MVFNTLQEAYTRCQNEGKCLDVQDQKLIAVEPNESLERKGRLVEYLNQIDWSNIPSQSPNDWKIVEHYFRPVKRYNDLTHSTERKVENQMLKLYLKHSGLEVTEEECALLHQLPFDFSILTQIVTLLQKVKLPIESSLLEAFQFVEMKEHELEYAAPWIRGMTNWTEIALLCEKIKLQVARMRFKTLQCYEPIAQGLTIKEKMLLLTRFFPPNELDQFYHRLPPLNPNWTFQEKTTVIKKAIDDEKAQLAKITKNSDLQIALKKTPYQIREKVFDLSKHLIASIKKMSDSHHVSLITALNTIPPEKLPFFSGFVTMNSRSTIETLKRDIRIFSAAHTHLAENGQAACLNTFKNLNANDKNRVDIELTTTSDKRAYLEKFIGQPSTQATETPVFTFTQDIHFGTSIMDLMPLPEWGADTL